MIKTKYFKQISLLFIIIFLNINIFSQNNNITGNPLPENILKSIIYTVDNDTISLSDIINENAGKIIYIDFWASWCKMCIKELPYSNELHKKFENEDIVFVYISTDENSKDWKKSLEKHEINGLCYRLEKESKQAIKDYLNIEGIPFIFILDKKGNIANKKAKYPSDTNAEEQLKEILNN